MRFSTNRNVIADRLERYAALVALASKNNGRILTTEWQGSTATYKCQLSDGRIVDAPGQTLSTGVWPYAHSDKKKQAYYKKLVELATKNDGKILTPAWQGNTIYYDCLLTTGVVVPQMGEALLKGHWPKAKPTAKEQFEFLQKIAQKHNHKLIQTEWLGTDVEYSFETPAGSIIKLPYKKLRRSGWPSDKTLVKTVGVSTRTKNLPTDAERIQKMNDLANMRGGKLLDHVWIGRDSFYNFEDAAGHKFRMRGGASLRGSWSLKAGQTTEPLCRQIMEYIFSTKFPNRWDILTPDLTGRPGNLELDGFSNELNIAFEYQGFPSHWRENHSGYNKTKIRDAAKVTACKNLNIKLIIIPPYNKNIHKKDAFFHHILHAVQNAYADNQSMLNALKITPCALDFSKLSSATTDLQKFKDLVSKYHMKLLNTEYKGMDTQHGILVHDKYVVLRTYRTIKHTIKHHGLPVIVGGDFSRHIERFEQFKKILDALGCTLKNPGWFGTDHDYEVSTPFGDCTLPGIIISKKKLVPVINNSINLESFIEERQLLDKNNESKQNNKTVPLIYDLAECVQNPSLYE